MPTTAAGCRDDAAGDPVVTLWQYRRRYRAHESQVIRGTQRAATRRVGYEFDPYRDGYDLLLLLLVIGYPVWKHLKPPPNHRLRLWICVGGGVAAVLASTHVRHRPEVAGFLVGHSAILVAIAVWGEIITAGRPEPPVPRAVANLRSGTRGASERDQLLDAREPRDRTRTPPRYDDRGRC
jgi:hypothetical protein